MKKLIVVITLVFCGFTSPLSAQTTAADSVSTVKLTDYAGKYKFSGFFTEGVVETKDGDLYAELDSYGKNKLLKQNMPDTYKSTSSYGTMFTFKRNDKGKVVGLKLELMDQELTGEKVE